MDKLEMVKFDENGQAYIDFEALELITSVEFVSFVKENIAQDFALEIKYEKPLNFDIRFLSNKDDYSVLEVLVSAGGCLAVYQYSRLFDLRGLFQKNVVYGYAIRFAVESGGVTL